MHRLTITLDVDLDPGKVEALAAVDALLTDLPNPPLVGNDFGAPGFIFEHPHKIKACRGSVVSAEWAP